MVTHSTVLFHTYKSYLGNAMTRCVCDKAQAAIADLALPTVLSNGILASFFPFALCYRHRFGLVLSFLTLIYHCLCELIK